MPKADRLRCEQAFHDRQALDRASTYALDPTELVFSDPQYLDHESWIRPAFKRLGPQRGQTVLDYGSGHGMAAVVLARAGARVTAVDLSCGYLNEARLRAQANDVSMEFISANAEKLPLADNSFDLVWGCAILHHLNIEVAASELNRVLRDGGRAVFCEPWGENGVLNWARRYLPYPAKQRTIDERPLRADDLRLLRKLFPKVETEGFQFLTMVGRLGVPDLLVTRLARLDAELLTRVPSLARYCRYVIITIQK